MKHNLSLGVYWLWIIFGLICRISIIVVLITWFINNSLSFNLPIIIILGIIKMALTIIIYKDKTTIY